MVKETNAVLVLLFAIVIVVVLTTLITMQVAEKAAPAQKAATAQGIVSFTIVPAEQLTLASPEATGSVTLNLIKQ